LHNNSGIFKKFKVSQQKKQNDYRQNYYKIYHLAVVYNIASNKYWKDLLAFVHFFKEINE